MRTLFMNQVAQSLNINPHGGESRETEVSVQATEYGRGGLSEKEANTEDSGGGRQQERDEQALLSIRGPGSTHA